MSEIPIIDMHNHVYPSADLGRRNQRALGVVDPPRDGTVEELLRLNEQAGISHAVLLLYLSAGRMFESRALHLPPESPQRERAVRELKEMLTGRIVRYNEWGVAAANKHPTLSAFVGVDPIVMGSDAMLHELEDKLSKGASGVKIHPGNIGVYLNDPRLWAVYEFCSRTGLPVLTQTGSGGLNRDLGGFEPLGNARYLKHVLSEFPDLKIIAAHFNLGCDPEEIVALAQQHRGFYTDLSNQVARWGEAGHWTIEEGVEWIRRVGAEKVLFGSNYVGQDPRDIAHKLRTLPITAGELEMIASENARSLLNI